MREGPQLGVDAFSISNYGSAMFAQVQPQHSPLMLLTPTASAASLGYAGLQAARRNTRFARYCEENTWRKRQPYGSTMTTQAWSRHSPFKVVADAFFSKRAHIHNKKITSPRLLPRNLLILIYL